ncbi:MAG: beta-ketoacyl synthase N-terminal-like domain-containing protein [Candidatus Omnitrophota bacterium]
MGEVISGIHINRDPDTLELEGVRRSVAAALKESGTVITKDNCYRVGIFLGTTFSNFKIRNINAETYFAKGVRAVNPADFPKGLISYLAGNISIAFNIRGANSTISSGRASGIDALLEAMYFLRRDKNNSAVVVEFKETLDKKSVYPILANVSLVIRNCSSASQKKDNVEVCGLGYAFERAGATCGLIHAVEEALAFSPVDRKDLSGIFFSGMSMRQKQTVQRQLNERFGYSGKHIEAVSLADATGLFGIGDMIIRKRSVLCRKKMSVTMFLNLGENTNSSCVMLKINGRS